MYAAGVNRLNGEVDPRRCGGGGGQKALLVLSAKIKEMWRLSSPVLFLSPEMNNRNILRTQVEVTTSPWTSCCYRRFDGTL